MLSYVNGTIQAINDQELTVDVGSFALTIHVPSARLFQVGSKTIIHTHMHWNQEQGPTLYGFATQLDRTVFLLIISCSGLGPRIGLALLDQLGAPVFVDAVQTGNQAALSKVSGIGAKKAEQLVIQLRDKVAKLLKSGIDLGGAKSVEQWHNVSEVLTSLNYTRTEIAQAMKYLGDTHAGSTVPFDQLMRQALAFLSKRAAA